MTESEVISTNMDNAEEDPEEEAPDAEDILSDLGDKEEGDDPEDTPDWMKS